MRCKLPSKVRDAADMSWQAARGATLFARAVVAGDLAPSEVIARRRDVCRSCEHRVRAALFGAFAVSDWCGAVLKTTPVDIKGCKGCTEAEACGCLIAGKTAVASQSCPLGKWREVSVTIKGQRLRGRR